MNVKPGPAEGETRHETDAGVARYYYTICSRQTGFDGEYAYPMRFETRAEALWLCREWNTYWQGEKEFWVVQWRERDGQIKRVRSYHGR